MMICYNSNWYYIDIAIGILALLFLSNWIAKIPNIWLNRFIMWLGYSSMTIYLFHRQLFAGVKCFFPVFPVWFAYLIVMPLTMFVGWSLQTIYDKAINSLEKKR